MVKWALTNLVVLLSLLGATRQEARAQSMEGEGGRLAQEEMWCQACGQRISGQYLLFDREGEKFPYCLQCGQAERERIEAQTPTCSWCGRRISGQYTVVQRDGRSASICAACLERSERCQVCNAPLREGRGLCAACAKLPKCSLCGQVIVGRCLSYEEGDSYCQTCADDCVRCTGCKRPLARGREVLRGGQSFCDRCAAQVPVCSTCGKAIMGVACHHRFAEGVFCEACERDLPKCVACGRPMTEGKALKGGRERLVCNECFPTIVLKVEKLRSIFAECQALISGRLGKRISHSVPVTMVDDIDKVWPKKEPNVEGDRLGVFVSKGDEYNIYVLGGVTEALAYEVLAHEWGHAWTTENGFTTGLELWESEGFCEWIASQVLRVKRLDRALQILDAREDDVYGKGYRFMREIEKKSGPAGVFQYIASRGEKRL